MAAGWIFLLVIMYFQIGWCWANILGYIDPNSVNSPVKYSLTLILWPLSMIISEDNLEDFDDHHRR